MTPSVIIATNNSHKVDELRQMFAEANLEIRLLSLGDIGLKIDPDETGSTFQENAYIKAHAVFQATGLPVIADDSGLEVEALQGAPGVHSARYAGENASDADNRKHLQRQLSEHKADTSAARFRCVLCYMDPLRTLFGEGSCSGTVGGPERGEHGFGYDPLFVPDGHEQTFAQLTPTQKHSLSHRGQAVEDLVRVLLPIMTETGHTVDPDPLPMRDAVIMASVAAVTDNEQRLRMAVRLFVRSSADALKMYEALLQSYLFAGFPVALEALAILDEEVRAMLPDHHWPEAESFNVGVFQERGAELCEQIYGSVYEKMMARLSSITPDLSSWMIVEGYGKTLSRDGLDVVTRELCNVAILAVLGRRNQLVSHVRGSVNVGATTGELQHCADAVTEWGSAESGVLLRRVIAKYGESREPTTVDPSEGRNLQ